MELLPARVEKILLPSSLLYKRNFLHFFLMSLLMVLVGFMCVVSQYIIEYQTHQMSIEIWLASRYFGRIFHEKSRLMSIRSHRNKSDAEENTELKKRNNSFLPVCNKKATLLRVNVSRDHKSTSLRGTHPQFKRWVSKSTWTLSFTNKNIGYVKCKKSSPSSFIEIAFYD